MKTIHFIMTDVYFQISIKTGIFSYHLFINNGKGYKMLLSFPYFNDMARKVLKFACNEIKYFILEP